MRAFTAAELPALFNEWMRRFTENPSAFESEFQTASLFLAEKNSGRVPTYGESCLIKLAMMRKDLANPPAVPVEMKVVPPKSSRRNRK